MISTNCFDRYINRSTFRGVIYVRLNSTETVCGELNVFVIVVSKRYVDRYDLITAGHTSFTVIKATLVQYYDTLHSTITIFKFTFTNIYQ